MDYKSRASGDNSDQAESERLTLQEKQERLYSQNLAYAATALDCLLTFTTDPDMPQDLQAQTIWRERWIKRLATIPRWKLIRTIEYTGEFARGIWAWYDLLTMRDYDNTPKLEHKEEPNVAKSKACVEALNEMTSDKISYVEYLERIAKLG